MKLLTLRSYGYHVSALLLLAFLSGMLHSSNGSAVPGLPSSIPRGTLFTLAHALWLQSQNEQFQLDLRSWVDSGVEQCMSGIRYTFKTPNALIWSFNSVPEPWIGNNCTLEFRSDGVLAFSVNLNGSSSPTVVWQTPTSGSRAENLTLQDDGNLVLLDVAGDIVWQSFGFFNDVLIIPSGMMFFSNTTLFDRVPVYSDFSIPGCYAASLSQQGRILLFTRANMFVYYSLGLNESTGSVPNHIVIHENIEFYNNLSVLLGSIAHNVLDNDPLPNGTDLIGSALFNDANFMIGRPNLNNPSEQLWYYNSSMSSFCDYPLVCGEYGLCNEATRECSCPVGFKMAVEKPACKAQDEATRKCSCPEEFRMPNFKSTCIASDPAYSLQPINVSFHPQPSAISVSSQDECVALCGLNASCNAALFDSSSSSCALFPILYTIALPSEGTETGQVMFLKVSSSNKSSKLAAIIISTTVVGAAVALFLLFLIAWKWWLNKSRVEKTQQLFLQELSKLPPRFSYKDLQVATNDFSKRLAVGAFGSVFEGVLSTSNGAMKVVVKRLEQVGNTRDHQFKAEVATIGSVSHMNLVSLKGFCMERDARLLVFEFMPRGSLDKWLYDLRDRQGESSNSSSGLLDQNTYAVSSPDLPALVLDWEKRCRIALDTAKGLEYLHHQSSEHIVHCDVKPANILLDEDFHAKVADFGLAKLMGSGIKSFTMTTLKGTRGYLAPEWLQEATITAKSDVYSYGVVLLELLTGHRCLDPIRGYLPVWAMKIVAAMQNNAASKSSLDASKDASFVISSSDASFLQSAIMDERLHACDVPADSFVHILMLALACVQTDPVDRPSMASVVQILEGMTEVPYSLQGLKLSHPNQYKSQLTAGPDSSASYTIFSGTISTYSQMLSQGR
ncbi:hypothetical protein L7F22_004250 [Adiantum nelumboides]|nr:hypothetical protein [Adiantum nelumboides]